MPYSERFFAMEYQWSRNVQKSIGNGQYEVHAVQKERGEINKSAETSRNVQRTKAMIRERRERGLPCTTASSSSQRRDSGRLDTPDRRLPCRGRGQALSSIGNRENGRRKMPSGGKVE